jgi:Meiotically up-regulated gene 113
VSRAHIVAEIRRTAEENGGKPLGRQRFRAETGLRDADWLQYWPRWSEALKEAGFDANTLQGHYTDEQLLRPLADEVRRFGRMPTYAEMTVRRNEGAPLPNTKVYSNRWTKAEMVAEMRTFSRAHPELADIAYVLDAAIVRDQPASAPEVAPWETTEFGFVYLIKSGKHYKLGRTNAAGPREHELAIRLPERTTRVHSIKTDDPAGIEAYWHRRFADQHEDGEWFKLTPEDVAAFKRRTFM